MPKRGRNKKADLERVPMASVAMPPTVKEALAACTPVQRRFVVNYCGPARANGTLAAKLAGITGKYNTIASQASHLLRDERVRKAIEGWMVAYATTPAQLTASLQDLSEANLGPFVEVQANGSLVVKLPSADVWHAYKHWIKSAECDPKTGRVTHLTLHDPLVAKRELAKILKLYSDAPVVNLSMYLAKLSNDELIRQYEEANKAIMQPGMMH